MTEENVGMPGDGPTGDATETPAVDPVLARRRKLARGAATAKRVGYLLYAAAVVMFVVAMLTDLPPVLVQAIIACLAVGAVLLAPAIVIGYGVKAADREDREQRRVERGS